MGVRASLTDKRRKLAEGILRGMDNTAAAIAAGYAPKTAKYAHRQAMKESELYRQYVAKRTAKIQANYQIDTDWIVKKHIANVEWGESQDNAQGRTVMHAALRELQKFTGGFVEKSKHELMGENGGPVKFVMEDIVSGIPD